MTDDTAPTDDEIERAFEEMSEGPTEVYECQDAFVVFPHGSGYAADVLGAIAFRVIMSKRDVEALVPTSDEATTYHWKAVSEVRKGPYENVVPMSRKDANKGDSPA